MKVNKWTVGLAAAGLVSLPWIAQAEEKALSPVMTALSSTTLGGYVDTSAHWNFGTGNANPAPYLYNAGKADGFNLDRVDVTLARPMSEENWRAGYRVDLWFGPDANVFDTTSTGINTSDLAIKQAYVALGAPVGSGLDFKLGVFNGIIGYESHDNVGVMPGDVENGNYTRPYATSLEPHTHTGLLATYHLFDWVDLSAGVANTLGPTINARSTRAESHKTYLGSIDLKAPDSWGCLAGSKLTAGAVTGFGTRDENQDNYYVGARLNTPIQHLTVGGSLDYVRNIPVSSHVSVSAANTGISLAIPGDQFTAARSYAVYASYQMEKWGLHLRGEYAEAFAQLGSSISTDVNGVPVSASLVSPTRADVLALTGTISYDLWKNVLTRLELRWDHAADGTHGGKLFGGDEAGNPTRKNEYLLAANVIYKF